MDTKLKDVKFEIGDWVMVKLRPHKKSSVWGQSTEYLKLAKRFYVPFQVIDRIGPTAYKLQLLEEACIHPVFHCSILKPFHHPPSNDNLPSLALLVTFDDDHLIITPLSILYTRKTVDSKLQVLVQCQRLSLDDTSWEDWDQLQSDYHLEDKVLLDGKGNDNN